MSRSLVRTILNIANGVEAGDSFLSDDRFLLAKKKLNDTVETLRVLQNKLVVADFQFSASFSEYLHSEIEIQHLGREGDSYVTNINHYAAINEYVGLVQEFIAMDEHQLRGALNLMSLESDESSPPSPTERLACFLVLNGNDALREWNWKFALRFVSDAEANSQVFLKSLVDMTIVSVCLIFFFSLVLAVAVGQAEGKKLAALHLFAQVPI